MFELHCAATGSELSQPASSGEDDETGQQTDRQTDRATDRRSAHGQTDCVGLGGGDARPSGRETLER